MQFLSSNIKKTQETENPKKILCILGNRNPKKASYILGNGTFQPKPQKWKKPTPKKNFLYFGKWNFLTLRSKNFSYFLKRKLFLYSLKKVSHTFQPGPTKTCSEKFSYIFSKKTPFFGNENLKKILIFQETEFCYTSESPFPRSKVFYTFSYEEVKIFKFKYFLIIIIWHFFSFYNIFFLYSTSFYFSSSERFL